MKKKLFPALWFLTALMLALCLTPCAAWAREPDENTQWLRGNPVNVTTYGQLVDALSHNEEEPDENNIVWIDVARLAADITIHDGEEIHSRGFLEVPSGRTLTIEDGGVVTASFQVEKGGEIIVKTGGCLATTMGDDCVNHGRLIVEPDALIQSQMGASIINARDGYMKLDGVFNCGGYHDEFGENHVWILSQGTLDGRGFVRVGPLFTFGGMCPLSDSIDAASKVRAAIGSDNEIRVIVTAETREELEELATTDGVEGIYLDTDITLSEGTEFDTRKVILLPEGKKLTIEEDGDWTSSFYIQNGAEVVVRPGATLATTMGDDCHNRGRLVVELGANLVSRFGTAIINDEPGELLLDGLFSVGGYQDENKVNHMWFGNTGSIEGEGFIVTGPVAMVSEDASLAAKLDAASQIKAALAQGSGVRVLVTAMDSAEMKQLNETDGVDGFMLNIHNPYEDEPEGGESEPKFFVIEDSMDTTGKVVYNIGESVIINPGVSFTTDCYLSTSDVTVQDSTLTVNGKFIAHEVTVGGSLVIGDNADIVVQKLLFTWPSKPCEVRNISGEIVYGAMYDLNDGSEPVSMNESEDGKFYLPANPTKNGYTFAGWKITSGWQGSSVWTSAMETALAGMKVKTDSRGSYVEEPSLFPLSITAQWTKPTTSDQFTDVQDPNHPYYNAIYWAAKEGITKGYSDGSFGIDKSCTRGEMIMFLWRFAGKPAPKSVSKSPFKDVPTSHSFYKAVLWAYQTGVTKGYSDGTFGINRNVSRGECMMFLWRVKGKPAPKAVSKSPFKDVPKTHAFYNAILWGSQKGITKGYTSGARKGEFGINDNCTRGQIVTFLYRAK